MIPQEMIFSRKQYLKIGLGISGGLFAGIGLSGGSVFFVWISIAILWASRDSIYAGFLWGSLATLFSHKWLLSLHPLNWIGVQDYLSLPITILIWLFCGFYGGFLVCGWCLLGDTFFFKKAFDKNFNWQFLNAFALALIWGLMEISLSKTPLFWIGIGGSLLPDDRFLAGLARWFGEGGLATLQILIGWWLWKIFFAIRKRLRWVQLFSFGLLLLLFAHFLGWMVLLEDDFYDIRPVALWQTNIPTREKFSPDQIERLQSSFEDALKNSYKMGADLMIAPEGTLPLGESLVSVTPLQLLSGGFRTVKGKQRSSLLFFAPGSNTYSEFIDKHRLVPLGEWLPSLPIFLSRGLSAVGGIEPGYASRFFKWQGQPAAVAICYEISDGNALADATRKGAEWIVAIANLDPYPLSLQRQFLSLAQLRSIELNRDLISVANTGPTLLVSSSGNSKSAIAPFREGLVLVNLHFSNQITGYVRWGEIPLIGCLFFSMVFIFYFRRYL